MIFQFRINSAYFTFFEALSSIDIIDVTYGRGSCGEFLDIRSRDEGGPATDYDSHDNVILAGSRQPSGESLAHWKANMNTISPLSLCLELTIVIDYYEPPKHIESKPIWGHYLSKFE